MTGQGESGEYLEELKRRGKESRVYTEHQLMGLLIAEVLHDEEHKSLYMRLAKKHGGDTLLRIAKEVAERENVENRGAYFMKIVEKMDMLKNGKDSKDTK